MLKSLFAADLLSSGQVTQITTALTTFGNMLLDAFIQVLPAIAVIAAIFYVIAIIRSKVN